MQNIINEDHGKLWLLRNLFREKANELIRHQLPCGKELFITRERMSQSSEHPVKILGENHDEEETEPWLFKNTIWWLSPARVKGDQELARLQIEVRKKRLKKRIKNSASVSEEFKPENSEDFENHGDMSEVSGLPRVSTDQWEEDPWKTYIGQERVVRRLKRITAVAGNDRPQVCLLRGNPGRGKSEAAKRAAADIEPEGNAFQIEADCLEPNQLRTLVQKLNKRENVLILDDIHHMSEALKPVLLEFIPERICQLSIFMTAAGSVSQEIRRRATVLRLGNYSDEEYREMLHVWKKASLQQDTSEDWAEPIIEHGARSPEWIRRIFQEIQVAAEAEEVDPVDREFVREIVQDMNIVSGLDAKDRQILSVLSEHDSGLSVRSLAGAVDLSVSEIKQEREPHLKSRGLMTVDSGGRKITNDGRKLKKKFGNEVNGTRKTSDDQTQETESPKENRPKNSFQI